MRTMVKENVASQEQVHSLTREVEASKARAKEISRLSCEQVEDFDRTIAGKEQEIAQLRTQLEGRTNHRRPSPSPSEDFVSEPTTLPSSREPRRGRAPPIDKFLGKVQRYIWMTGFQACKELPPETSGQKKSN